MSVFVDRIRKSSGQITHEQAPPIPVGLMKKKGFIVKHEKNVKGGMKYLNEFFNGRSRKRGEEPKAKRFRASKKGYYAETEIVEYLKKIGCYSSLGYGNSNPLKFAPNKPL